MISGKERCGVAECHSDGKKRVEKPMGQGGNLVFF